MDDLVRLLGTGTAKKVKEQVGGFVKKETWEQLEKGEESKQKALTEY
jgi:hypothetical protein